MDSSSLEWLTAQPRTATPPRWLATGEKITRAAAASPPFDSPASPSVVDRRLREKGASLVKRRGEPVLSDAVLDALRAGYDTRGDMSAGGVKQAACAGGQPRWRSVCIAPKERRKRFGLSPVSVLRQQKKYAAVDEQEQEQEQEQQEQQEQAQDQPTTVPGQQALRWKPPTPEHNASAWPAPLVVQAGRRRGMLQHRARAVRLDLAIEDVCEHARQNLAHQREAILQLTAATSQQLNGNRLRARQVGASRSTQSSDSEHAKNQRDGGPQLHDHANLTVNSSAADFLKQVKRRYECSDGLSAGGVVPRFSLPAAATASASATATATQKAASVALSLSLPAAVATAATATQKDVTQSKPVSNQPATRAEQLSEQRNNEHLRNAPDLAAAAVRKSHAGASDFCSYHSFAHTTLIRACGAATKKFPSFQRKSTRPARKADSDAAARIADENWSVIGWGVADLPATITEFPCIK